ncbi:hypothetical protein VTI74DRAFT_387 [Chaetomium olivicolor]
MHTFDLKAVETVIGVVKEGLNGTIGTSKISNGVNGDSHASKGVNGAGPTAVNGTRHREDVPVAIVDMALRLPGGIGTEEASGTPKTNKRGSVKTQNGYFLDERDLHRFDTSFFSITRNELEKLDPQHRVLLEVTRECLENAGEVDWRGKDVGCYVGTFGEDWLDLHAKDSQDFSIYQITGTADFVLANRILYEYDFRGPSRPLALHLDSLRIGVVLVSQQQASEIEPPMLCGRLKGCSASLDRCGSVNVGPRPEEDQNDTETAIYHSLLKCRCPKGPTRWSADICIA